MLVEAFLNEYLEADGYFFLRLLTANASDFVVQEILEQLWTTYVMKYGENDATRAEQIFFEFRNQSSLTSLNSQVSPTTMQPPTRNSELADSKRKHRQQFSDVTVGLLNSSSSFQPTMSISDDRDGYV